MKNAYTLYMLTEVKQHNNAERLTDQFSRDHYICCHCSLYVLYIFILNGLVVGTLWDTVRLKSTHFQNSVLPSGAVVEIISALQQCHK